MIRTCPACGIRHDRIPDDVEPCGSCLQDTWACTLGRAVRAFVQRAERDTLDAVLRATTATLERVTRDLAAVTRERDEARADVEGLRRLLEAVSTACQPASADELDAARMEAEAARAERDAMRATLDRAVRLLHALAAPGGRQP